MDFWEIYDQHYRPVRAFLFRMIGDQWVAEDLTQETFIKVQEKIDQLRDPSKVRPWIFRIARNLSLDHYRSQKNGADNREISGKIQTSLAPPAQMQLERQQMSECVQEKIHLLPEPLKAVLILFDVWDLSQQEIAEILEISVANVKVRLHRARKALKEILERDCNFEHDERNVMVCTPKPKCNAAK